MFLNSISPSLPARTCNLTENVILLHPIVPVPVLLVFSYYKYLFLHLIVWLFHPQLYIYLASTVHPASSSTSIFSLYASLSLYIRPHPLHPSSASTPSLSLYIQRNPLHSSSASTPILSVYIHHQPLHQPQPLQRASTSSLILSLYSIHPASVSTSGLLLYESTSIIRLFTQAQLLHSQSASTINPFSASKSGLRLDTQRQIICTSSLSFYIWTQPLHSDSASTPGHSF